MSGIAVQDAVKISRAIATGDLGRVEAELSGYDAEQSSDLANICASLMGCLSSRYLESTGDSRLATMSDKDIGRVFIIAFAESNVSLDRTTRRSITKSAAHIVRKWQYVDGAWPGGSDFGWVMYMAVSAAAALRARGGDPDAVVREWIEVVFPGTSS